MTKLTALEAACRIVNLDDGAIPEWAVIVVGYLSEDADPTFKYGMTGASTYAQIDWALTNIRHDLLHLSDNQE